MDSKVFVFEPHAFTGVAATAEAAVEAVIDAWLTSAAPTAIHSLSAFRTGDGRTVLIVMFTAGA